MTRAYTEVEPETRSQAFPQRQAGQTRIITTWTWVPLHVKAPTSAKSMDWQCRGLKVCNLSRCYLFPFPPP